MARRVDEVEPGADDGDRAAPPPASAPSCAAPSMPSASPETTTQPAPLRCAAKARAFSSPCGVGLRLPTIAIAGACSSSIAAAHIQQQRRVGGCRAAPPDSAGRRARRRRAASSPLGQPCQPAREARVEVLGRRRQRARPRSGATTALARRGRGAEHGFGRAEARRAAARADSRPTPGVSSRRSHAANSSRSIMRGARAGSRCATPRKPSARPERAAAASLGLGEAVARRDRVLDRQDQRIRHAVEDAEHEQQAVRARRAA